MKRLLPLSLLPLLVLATPGRADRPEASLAARIDGVLEQAWRERGLEPAPLADDLTFYRRLSLDLIGTIPSLEEVRALEAVAPAERRARAIELVTKDARFHEAFAERLARIVVGAGQKKGDLFYRRRRFVEWLRAQLVARKRWDAIARALIAAEGATSDGPANFVVAADADANKLVSRTTRAFLGIRIDCAQCHDHPFAAWKQADYEGLAAFFARARRRGPLVTERRDGEYEIDDRMSGKPRRVTPRVPYAPEALPELAKRREALARWVTDPGNPWFTRSIANRIWAQLMGRGLIEPLDEIDEGKATFPEVLRLLEDDLRANGFDLERLVRAIVSTRAYARASRAPGNADALLAAHALYPLKPLHPDQLGASIFQATTLASQPDDQFFAFKLFRLDRTRKFATRHGGDLDAEWPEDSTLLQRLLLVNGELVHGRIRADRKNPFGISRRLLLLAPTDDKLIETAYLAALTRRPTGEELAHFRARLAGKKGGERERAVEDLLWALLNSVEFSWNH